MNRMLAIPAGCCLIAYVAVFTNLNGARSESVAGLARLPEAPTPALVPLAVPAAPAPPAPLLSRVEAERMLEDLQNEYLRPYREWEASPHRLMSRAAVRIEPSSSQYALATNQPGDHELLATIVIKFGANAQTIPCVIDRATKGVGVFANGQWITGEEWLKSAPHGAFRRR